MSIPTRDAAAARPYPDQVSDLVLSGGTLALPDGLVDDGWLTVSGGLITATGTGAPPPGEQVELDGALVVPGFIDIHCHGGGGASFSSTDDDEISRAIATHRRHGTTTMLASTVSEPIRALSGQLAALRGFVEAGELAGVHAEGPFLAATRCGAHDASVLLEPDATSVDLLLRAGAGTLRMVTLAPELNGGLRAVRQLTAAGVIAAIGHTDATVEQARPAIDAGATVATHLFNGMRPLHHREPGAVAALLDDDRVTVELICDLVHVHAALLRLVTEHAGGVRTVLVTDAMSATDAPDGRYRLGRLDVDVRDRVATVAGTDGLAGSTLTMDGAFRNLVRSAGVSISGAVHATSRRPAELLGIEDRTGALRPGLAADLVVLDDELHPTRVLRRGAWVR